MKAKTVDKIQEIMGIVIVLILIIVINLSIGYLTFFTPTNLLGKIVFSLMLFVINLFFIMGILNYLKEETKW